jgi:hypothetical protein
VTYAPTHVLGLDQAASSGWGIAPIGGKLLEHGVARDCTQRAQVLRRVLEIVQAWDALLVVFEDHTGFWQDYGTNRTPDGQHRAPKRNAAVPVSLGESRGRWFEQLELAGHPKLLRIGVAPSDWQPRVLGVPQRIGSAMLKHHAKEWASRYVGKPITDENEADGICITAWGALDGASVLANGRKERRVNERVKRARKKQMALFGGT